MKSYSKPKIKNIINRSLPKQLIDLSPKQFENIKSVGEIILGVASVLGIATMSVVAPNSLKMLKAFSWTKRSYSQDWSESKNRKHQLTQTFYYLKKHKYIELEPTGNDYLVKLTKKGKSKLLKMNFENIEIKKPKHWDGLWWLVLADIPTEDYKTKADLFRKKLKKLDFFPLQRTVWFYPFDPREEVAFIAARYEIERFVTTAEIKTLDSQDEQVLKKFFKTKGLL